MIFFKLFYFPLIIEHCTFFVRGQKQNVYKSLFNEFWPIYSMTSIIYTVYALQLISSIDIWTMQTCFFSLVFEKI